MSSKAYGTIPDLISSSVSLNIDNEPKNSGLSTRVYTSGTIYPLAPQRSIFKAIASELHLVMHARESKSVLLLLALNFIGSCVLLVWCHKTNSMALTAYTYLTIYDIFCLIVCLLSFWVKRQKPSPAYSFGYERFEVLAVFACTMLTQLGALFVVKESIERLLLQPDIHSGRLLIGTLFAFSLHMFVSYSANNRAVNHVIDASSSSWLQEHMTDMSESLCHLVPGLSKLLLPRINPMALIGFSGGFLLCFTYILIDTKMYYSADTWAAVMIAFMTCGTMFPMSVYTGKILLQTSPSHILGQLDKVLREASTLDGVLEFRHEHFWTLSFGTLAGSVQVRVRRDADEQMVLAHVYNRLSNLVSPLTVQIFKDDWTRSSYSVMGGHGFPSRVASPSQTFTQGQNRGPSPILDHSQTYSSGGGFKTTPIAPPSISQFDIQGPASTFSADFHASTPLRGSSSYTSSSKPFSLSGYGTHS